MRKTSEADISKRITVNTEELKMMCGCGKDTAIRIGCEAGAKIKIGRRVLWNVAKVQKYMDKLSGKQNQDGEVKKITSKG